MPVESRVVTPQRPRRRIASSGIRSASLVFLAYAQRLRWSRTPPWPGFFEPFNGQSFRRKIVDRLIHDFQPDVLLETGTFLGRTTQYLAEKRRPVFTCEIHPGFFRLARRSLRKHPHVTILFGDSVEGLRWVASEGSFNRPFIYLDAHWEAQLPLADEVELITSSWRDVAIVIDDFLVPGHPGYAYDIYRGIPLAIEMLSLPAGCRVGYPALPPRNETGARRGSGFIGCGSVAAIIDELVAAGLLFETPSPGASERSFLAMQSPADS